ALLSTLGVPAILLKGAALVPTVYKDKSLRWMGDVDILVRTVDMPEVDNTLNLLGYKSTPMPYSPQLQKCTKCLMYEKNDSPLYIDVHWHLVNPTILKYVYEEKVNIDRLWQEAVPVRIGQVNALCLAPHHQLLHLSEHAMKHSYISLLSMWDIKEVIDHWGEKLDWKGSSAAFSGGTGERVGYACYFTHRVFRDGEKSRPFSSRACYPQ
ncbi:MAG TPA: nucleotidyltransferase family protein, partial [Candidatus Tripitaka sp. YC43]